MPRRNLTTRRNRGFTLIEVLVSLVVLSMGLLGVAALQLTSLRNNTSAAQRSQATFLAYDIADRMRANVNAARELAYVVSFDSDTPAGENAIARADVLEWKTRIRTTFPAGADGKPAAAEIKAVQNAEDRFTITIRWNDTRGDGDPITFSTQVQI